MAKKPVAKKPTVIEDSEDTVAKFDLDDDGNVIVGANLENFIRTMKIDLIIEQPIFDRYNSMFGKLLLNKGTMSPFEQAFFDLFLYALALKVKYEGEV